MKALSSKTNNKSSLMLLQSVQIGREVVKAAAEALTELSNHLGREFEDVVMRISNCPGRVIMCGIGKSGHIARKISSTLSSTGTPSLFLHPAEASHGDLGMIVNDDIVICLSKSGESRELADIISHCHRRDILLVAITANKDSTLARASSYVLLIPAVPEAGPLSVAPTTSSSCMLALGDAIALSALDARGFGLSTFHELHPGGKLGQILARVSQIMSTGEQLPIVSSESAVTDALLEMTRTRFGCAGVVNSRGELIGIFTDGDLRRNLNTDLLSMPIEAVMTSNPRTISPDDLVADVVIIFRSKRVPSVFVTRDSVPIGIVHIHDLISKDLI